MSYLHMEGRFAVSTIYRSYSCNIKIQLGTIIENEASRHCNISTVNKQ